MLNWPILSVITFLPLAGALLIAVMPSHGEAEGRNVRWIALWVTLVTFAIALL
jgi:NADH-quinone oxidoreductase subunit M